MKKTIIYLLCLSVAAVFCPTLCAADLSPPKEWKASDCSCSPNAGMPVIGYYDGIKPLIQTEDHDPETETADYLNFSLVTRVAYVSVLLDPDGGLVENYEFDELKRKQDLARQFNTAMDLGVTLSPRFESFEMPMPEECEALASKMADRVAAFKNKQKEKLYKERVARLHEIISSQFASDLEQMQSRVDNMDSTFVEQALMEENLNRLNEKLNKTLDLVLKVKKLKDIVLTEKEKAALEQTILERLKLDKKENETFFKKMLNYILFFVPENDEALEKKSRAQADVIFLEEKEQIIQEFIDEFVKARKELIELPVWKEGQKKKDLTGDKLSEPEKEIPLESPDILMNSLAAFEADAGDCTSKNCRDDLEILEKSIIEDMEDGRIPEELHQPLQDLVTGVPPDLMPTESAPIRKKMQDLLQAYKKGIEKKPAPWQWQKTTKDAAGNVIRELFLIVEKTGLDGLTLDFSNLWIDPKNRVSQEFVSELMDEIKLMRERVRNPVTISLMISDRHLEKNVDEETGDNLVKQIKKAQPVLDYIIVKFKEPSERMPQAVQTMVSNYMTAAGATDKLLLYLDQDGPALLEPPLDEAFMRILKQNTAGLVIDPALFVSDQDEQAVSTYLSSHIMDEDTLFFARQLLYELNHTFLGVNLCELLCPFKEVVLKAVYVSGSIWLLIWLMSSFINVFESFCSIRSFVTMHFIIFWGGGVLIFLSGFLVLMCDPFLKERRDDAAYVFAGIVLFKFVMFLWEKAGIARR